MEAKEGKGKERKRNARKVTPLFRRGGEEKGGRGKKMKVFPLNLSNLRGNETLTKLIHEIPPNLSPPNPLPPI